MRKVTIYSDEFNECAFSEEDTMVLDILPHLVHSQTRSLEALNIMAAAGEFACGSPLHMLTALTRLTSLEVCPETMAVARPCFRVSWRSREL